MAAEEPWPISIMAMTAADADDDAQRRQQGPHRIAPQGPQGRANGAIDSSYVIS